MIQSMTGGYVVVPSSTSSLNRLRKGSRSDFKKRVFRPISPEMGNLISLKPETFRVCGLTPSKRRLADSQRIFGLTHRTLVQIVQLARPEFMLG